MRGGDYAHFKLQSVRNRWDSLNESRQAVVLEKVALAAVLVASVYVLWQFSGAAARVGGFRHPTLVYDDSGNPWFNLHDPLGTHLKLSQFPPHVLRAVIAVEDKRFYDHGSIDIWGIGRAVLQNVRSTGIRQGASTLTQQLARQLFLTHRRTISRKLQEAILASELESQFSKDEILEAYLNRVFMGGSLYGMPSAARYFFGKDISQVTVSEAATLAAIIRAPNVYNSKVNPDRVIQRRNLVLQLMLDQGYLVDADYRRAVAEKMKFVRLRAVDRTETYFKEFVRSELAEALGEDILDEYGFSVYTSYSPQLQSLAENSANQEMVRLEAGKQLYRYPDQDLQVALVSLDVETGRINAMVGGRNYGGSQYNHVTQALRQPGSSFKPILYAAALSSGMTPATLVPVPTETPADIEELEQPLPEEPQMMTLREALTKSVNGAAISLIHKVGPAKTVEFAHQLGIQSALPQVDSLALGSGEVRVLELAAAYTAFASGGEIVHPHTIVRVQDSGGIMIYGEAAERTRVLSPEVAYQMTSMLSDVVTRGTAAGAATAGMPFPIAGKTGTTNDYKDAWFLGFSPRIVCAVWVGYDNPHPIMPGGYGARLALPIWGRYMRGTSRTLHHGTFAVPKRLRPIRLCRISGLVATDGCNVVMKPDGSIYSTAYTEYLLPGTEPVDSCPLHSAKEGGNIFESMGKWFRNIIPGGSPPPQ